LSLCIVPIEEGGGVFGVHAEGVGGFKPKDGEEGLELVDGIYTKGLKEFEEVRVGVMQVKSFDVVIAFGMKPLFFLFVGDVYGGIMENFQRNFG
jgi:hypothetical protein